MATRAPLDHPIVQQALGGALGYGLVAALGAAGGYLASGYQNVLKESQHAGFHLGPLQSFILSVPAPLLIVGFVLLVFGVVWLAVKSTRRPAKVSRGLITIEPPKPAALTDEQVRVLGDGYCMSYIKPLIRAYRKTKQLAEKLQVFEDGMERFDASIPTEPLTSMAAWVEKVGAKNSSAYDANYKPYIVSQVTDLKIKFGLTNAALTDEKLAGTVYGPLGVQPLVKGLNELAETLGKMLASEAAKLNV